MDEASRMRDEAFYAVRSTLTDTRGPVRTIGNVKDCKNWFYIGCRKACRLLRLWMASLWTQGKGKG